MKRAVISCDYQKLKPINWTAAPNRIAYFVRKEICKRMSGKYRDSLSANQYAIYCLAIAC